MRRVLLALMVAALSPGAGALAQPRPGAEVEEEPVSDPRPVARSAPAAEATTELPSAREIGRKLDELESRHDARRYVGPAIDHGRLALRRAEELEARGDTGAAERARQIAWAAYALASRQLALARERQALRAAARRLRRAEQQAARSREALERTLERREELRAPEPEERMAPADEPDDEGEAE